MTGIHRYFADQGLTRPTQGRVLGGVCAAIARRSGLDPWLVRIIVVATLVLLPGSQILLYPLAWAVLPDEAQVWGPSVASGTQGSGAAYPQDRV